MMKTIHVTSKVASLMLSLVMLNPCMLVNAACQPGEIPDHKSCCDTDTGNNNNQYECHVGQEKSSAAANVYCHQKCKLVQSDCKFTEPATSGCTSSGSYSNVWKWTNTGTSHQCQRQGQSDVAYYTYTAGSEPAHQGETQKYIIDEDNCGG